MGEDVGEAKVPIATQTTSSANRHRKGLGMERYDIHAGIYARVNEWEAVKAEDGDFVLYADAQATVEALQRERDFFETAAATANRMRVDTERALDAEREKVRTVEHELARIVKRNQGGYIGDRIAIDKCLTIIRTLDATTPEEAT